MFSDEEILLLLLSLLPGRGDTKRTSNIDATISHCRNVEHYGRLLLGCRDEGYVADHNPGNRHTCKEKVKGGEGDGRLSPIRALNNLLTTSAMLFGQKVKSHCEISRDDQNMGKLDEELVKDSEGFENVLESFEVTTSTPMNISTFSSEEHDSEDFSNIVLQNDHFSNTKHIRRLNFDDSLCVHDDDSESDTTHNSSDDAPCNTSKPFNSPETPDQTFGTILGDSLDEITHHDGITQNDIAGSKLVPDDLDILVEHLREIGHVEQTDDRFSRHDEISSADDVFLCPDMEGVYLERRLSTDSYTDSLTSFELHERDLMNQSLSPLCPLSPRTAGGGETHRGTQLSSGKDVFGFVQVNVEDAMSMEETNLDEDITAYGGEGEFN